MSGRTEKKNPGRSGGQYERKMSVRLSMWVSDGKSKDLFWRSGGSGARATVLSKKSLRRAENQQGDIVAIHEDGLPFTKLFVVELKNYATVQFESLFFERTRPQIALWWEKIQRQGLQVDRMPVLIVNKKRYGEVFITDSRGARWLELSRKPGKSIEARVYLPQIDAWVFGLRDVLTLVRPSRLLAARSRRRKRIQVR